MQAFRKLQLNLHHLTPYLRRYRRWVLLTVVFVLLKEGAVLGEPAIFRRVAVLFEELSRGALAYDASLRQSFFLIGAFIVLQATVLVTNTFMLRSINHLESSVMRDAANDFVAKVLHLSFRFHSERKTGKIAKEFARGVNGIEHFMDAFVFNLIPLCIRLVVIFFVFLWVDWQIALVLVGLVTAFCTFTVATSLLMQTRRTQANILDDEGSRKAIDALMNAEAVKYFQQEATEIRSFRRMRQDWKKMKQSEWNGWTWIAAGQIFINVVSVTIILSLMIWKLLYTHGAGSIGLPNFVLVISYIGYAVGMLWEFQHHFRNLHESFTDVSSFFTYFVKENEIKDTPNAQPLQVRRGEIRFEHVSFRYANHKTVLEDVSFVVPPGKSVAFVGPSGAGKSTIMKLLYRFYDPREGRVRIDGHDIRFVTQQSLREALGIVPQEAALFNETIAYNIAYGAPNATRKDIERAAHFAKIDRFIASLPHGYETIVGERGVKLSGGEKQRISIGRALLRNAPILVLDEATSSLDSQAEAEIQQSLRALMKNRTTLIIAHRLSTIMNADIIIVVNNKRVEQQGTHAELIKRGGLYHRLWELQAGGYLE